MGKYDNPGGSELIQGLIQATREGCFDSTIIDAAIAELKRCPAKVKHIDLVVHYTDPAESRIGWIREPINFDIHQLPATAYSLLGIMLKAASQDCLVRLPADKTCKLMGGITTRQLRRDLNELRSRRLIALFEEHGRGKPRIWMVNPALGGCYQSKHKAELQARFDRLAGDIGIVEASRLLPSTDLIRVTESRKELTQQYDDDGDPDGYRQKTVHIGSFDIKKEPPAHDTDDSTRR